MFTATTIQPRSGYQGIPSFTDEPIITIPTEISAEIAPHSRLYLIEADLELGRVLGQLELEPYPDEMSSAASGQFSSVLPRETNGRCCQPENTGLTTKMALIGGAVGIIAGTVIGAAELSKIDGQNTTSGGGWGALAGISTGAAIGAALGLAASSCRAQPQA